METSIRVNFGRSFPLFPLNSTLLMPNGVVPLYIFEERYRQMVSDALDGPGQIAMAVFEGRHWLENYHGRPPVRPAVCIGHILEHVKMADGCYQLALQGVCRARITEELPATEGRLYREVILEPVGLARPDEDELDSFRESLTGKLAAEPLCELRDAGSLVEHLRDDQVPTTALMEFITLTLMNDPETRYRLLAAGEPLQRARIIDRELESLAALLRKAAHQRAVETPKGCCWN